jgi:hypothetical protein
VAHGSFTKRGWNTLATTRSVCCARADFVTAARRQHSANIRRGALRPPPPVSQNASRNSARCLVAADYNGDSVYNSMQALVLRTNGFLLNASSLDIFDIDSQADVALRDATKESVAVFAMADGKFVEPDVTLHRDSVLRAVRYFVPSTAMQHMGFPREHARVSGAEFGADFAHNCVTGPGHPESQRCRMTANFSAGIDTLVVMHALVQKSRNETSSFVFVSDLKLRC